MRPDEFANTVAWRWNQAVQMRNAYDDGVKDAQAEKKARETIDQMWKQQGVGVVG